MTKYTLDMYGTGFTEEHETFWDVSDESAILQATLRCRAARCRHFYLSGSLSMIAEGEVVSLHGIVPQFTVRRY